MIEVKKQINCIGDVDALMNLQFFRVHGSWLKKEVGERLLEIIPKKVAEQIVIKGT